MFTLRFDMRAPDLGAPARDLYATAIEMAEWAENKGAVSMILCEHHGAEDGYLPAPLILASAMAARTRRIAIMVAIIQLPLYDPIRLAEEISVIDIISGGRVSYVGGLGYLPGEYEMMGVDFKRRGAIADASLDLLLRAKTGEPFEHEGRRIHVTPPPLTQGGPVVGWGGGSAPAAKRAGRHGIPFFAQKGDPELGILYEEACRANGHEPNTCFLPPRDLPTTTFVAEDVDTAWNELGDYIMHDVLMYAKWNKGNLDTTSLSFVQTAQELRAENGSHRIMSVDEAVAWVQGGSPLQLHPLVGGIPPDLAWKYLRVVTEKVMPRVKGGTAASRRRQGMLREERPIGEREQAIDDLLAKQEIAEAIFKYCRCMDRCDKELGKEVFHPDAIVDYGEQMYRGTGYGFVDMALSAHIDGYLSHSHQHGNILIRVDGDRAYSEIYGDVTLRRRDENGMLIDNRNLGRYLDLWEKREDGRWKIAERMFLTDFDETGPAAGHVFETTGRRDRSDPSYRLFEEGKLLS